MELEEYQRMFELEESHWWFQGRLMMTERLMRRHVLPALAGRRPRLLDVGCGTGLFLARRQAEFEAIGVDFMPEALAYCRRRGVRAVALGDAARLPLADCSVDVVTAFDLIEHLRDDRALIAELRRVLRPGGFLLATVPAHPLLWTGHDVSLHHHRRYTRAAFERLFDPGQWNTVRMTASFTTVFPVAAVIRGARHLLGQIGPPHSDTTRTPPWLNRLLISVHGREAAWLERHDLPIGISFLTIRQRRDEM